MILTLGELASLNTVLETMLVPGHRVLKAQIDGGRVNNVSIDRVQNQGMIEQFELLVAEGKDDLQREH